MRRVRDLNINTPEWWNQLHCSEIGADNRGSHEDRITFLRHYVLPGMKMLDVGCAAGKDLSVFPAVEPYGVDFSQIVLAHSPRKFYWVNGSTESLPFQDNSFDLVWSAHTLEHIEQVEQAAREITRVSRDKVVISVPYRSRIDHISHIWEFEEEDWQLFGEVALAEIAHAVEGKDVLWAMRKI